MPTRVKPKIFYGYIIVSASFIACGVMWGILYSFGVFFKPILTEFGWTRAQTSAAYSLCMISSAFLSIIVGRLTDRLGPRSVMIGCGLSLGLGYVFASLMSSIWQFYILYGFLIGIGMSGAYVPLLATVSRWFVKKRGMMTGISSSGAGVGATIVPLVVGRLIDSFDWRSAYMIVGITAFMLIFISALFLRRDPAEMNLRPYGGSKESDIEKVNHRRSFTLAETIRTWQLWIMCAIFAFNLLPLAAIVVHSVAHAIGLGISSTKATGIISFMGAGGIAGRIVLASAADKIGNKRIICVGFSLMALSLLWLIFAGKPWMFYFFGLAFGFAAQGLISLIPLLTAELFGLSSLGVLLGIINAGGSIGEGMGPVLAGVIFDLAESYDWAFILCAILSFVGIIFTLSLKPIDR